MILLSPHRDDETLFASFLILRHKPHVIVCVNAGGSHDETAEAMDVLGASWETLGLNPENPGWSQLRDRLSRYPRDTTVFAPACGFEANGHTQEDSPAGFGILHHDHVGAIAAELFDDVVFYTTYTRWGGRQKGTPVEYEPHWPGLKMRALACYQSQINNPSTQPWFSGGWLEEYVA